MKQTILILLSVLLGVCLTSCKSGHNKKERIAVVISTLNNPWFVVLGQTAVDRCEALGYEAPLFDSQNNPSKEAEHFDNIPYQAVLAAGKAGKIKVFGFDGADDCVNAIREGKIEATGMQFPKTMAKTAATLADRYIKGDRKLPKKLAVAVELVNKKNVAHYGNFGKVKSE